MAAPVAVYRQEGKRIDYTPVADVAAGEVIDLGPCVGIATSPIPAATLGSLSMVGVVRVNKFTGETWATGDKIYWDQGTLTATKTIGYAEATMGIALPPGAAAGDATGDVLYFPNFG